MPYSTAYCLEMPGEFPDAELSNFLAEARRVLADDAYPAAWAEFASASNLIGWRFRASSDALGELRSAILAQGNGWTHEDVYRQELAMFVMFTAGVSCIESACYAFAAAATHPEVLSLRFDKRSTTALFAEVAPQITSGVGEGGRTGFGVRTPHSREGMGDLGRPSESDDTPIELTANRIRVMRGRSAEGGTFEIRANIKHT